ncbi:MAG: DUF4184 family protein [Actinomycetia bacterium]|nr:DUF4184 family protein [Actinomycetes bacterium]MCP4086603.1 DUF4184 family protein [Actinomycetes bacterium]
MATGRLVDLMPVTFPAHQGLIAVVKLRWPQYVDGTALCIGAASPDFAYALGPWLNRQSHTAIGLLVWAIPFTLAATEVTRRRAAAGIFAHLPDLGPLRVRSYRVLGHRRPARLVTVVSVVVGAGSHVAIDAFTHQRRWGADLAGLNSLVFTAPVWGQFTVARVGQYLGHALGSLAFVAVLLVIAGSGRLERWYGTEIVDVTRAHRPGRGERAGFWLTVTVPTAAAAGAALILGRPPVFLAITVLVVAVITAGAMVPSATKP